MNAAATVSPPAHVADEGSGRILDPVARVSEVLFGLIMALTFTGSLAAATAGREEIRTLLIGIIGCNIAWGLVDAVGQHGGYHPWRTGLSMVVLGVVLVAVAIALGG